jgi:hypothetical protein
VRGPLGNRAAEACPESGHVKIVKVPALATEDCDLGSEDCDLGSVDWDLGSPGKARGFGPLRFGFGGLATRFASLVTVCERLQAADRRLKNGSGGLPAVHKSSEPGFGRLEQTVPFTAL